MTILAPSLISPATSKLLSYLSFSNNHNEIQPHDEPTASKSPDTTYISIIMKKDGTPTTKHLNNAKILSRRRRSSFSQYHLVASPPKQRKLMISSIIPKLYTSLSRKKSQPDILFLEENSTNSDLCLSQHNNKKKIEFINLPLEIIYLIILKLDYKSLLCLSRTNKKCYQLCHDYEYVWKSLFQSDYNILASTCFDYYELYKSYFELKNRWKYGKVKSKYLTGHQDSIYCLIWLNQDLIISGSRDKSIKLWNIHKKECLLSKIHHDGSVLCLRISSDKSFFVSGSSDTTLLIWSLNDFLPQKRLFGHTSGVLDIAIIENQYIISSSRDSTIRVWDKSTGSELRRLVGHHGPVNALGSFDHYVVSASGDSTLKLWNAHTGECLKTFLGHTRGLACVKFDGQFIYSGGQDNMLKIWNAETGECISTLSGHTDLIRTIDSFENIIVSGSYDKTLRVWDRDKNKCLVSFQSGHSSWIFNSLINRTKIVSAGQDKRIMVLDFGYDLKTID